MIGLFWVFFEKIGLTLLSVIATFWYANLLGPNAFGIAIIILSVSLLLSSIIDNIQQFPLIASKDNKELVFSTSLIGWFFISTSTSIILFFIMIFLFDAEYFLLILLSVIYIPISSVSRVYISDLIREQKYKSLALRSFLGKLVGVILGLITAYLGNAEIAIILQSLVSIIIALLVMVFYNRDLPKFMYKNKCFDWLVFKDILKEGIPSGFIILDQAVKSHGLIILLGVFVGPYASGVYALAIRFVDVPRTLVGYGVTTWATGQFHKIRDDKVKLLSLYKTAFLGSMLILTPCYIGLVSISHVLVLTYFGQEWEGTAIIIIFLSLYHWFLSFYLLLHPLQVLLKSTHKTIWVSIYSTITVVLSVVFLSRFLGLYSPIVAMFFSLSFIIPKFNKELKSLMSISFLTLLKLVSSIIFCSVLMLFIVFSLQYNYNVENLFYLVSIGFLCFSLSAFLLWFYGFIDLPNDFFKTL